MARHNCELTEQLGDVFSRSLALNTLAYVQLAAGENAEALETIELSDRLYREAMGAGGETEGWRSTLRARALLGLGRDRGGARGGGVGGGDRAPPRHGLADPGQLPHPRPGPRQDRRGRRARRRSRAPSKMPPGSGTR